MTSRPPAYIQTGPHPAGRFGAAPRRRQKHWLIAIFCIDQFAFGRAFPWRWAFEHVPQIALAESARIDDHRGLLVRGLRATASTRLQERGANEFDVKLHLGHSIGSMGITGRYIDPHEEHRRRIAELTVRQKPDNVVPLRPEFVTRLSSGGLAGQGGVG